LTGHIIQITEHNVAVYCCGNTWKTLNVSQGLLHEHEYGGFVRASGLLKEPY